MANILLGVTGGIAAYKAAALLSQLKKMNHQVDVCMTKAATEFVTPLTFQSLAQTRVITDMFGTSFVPEIQHISLAQKADLIIIAPATANVVAKIAHGIADDFLTTTVLAARCKILIAPAMNTGMYENVAYQENEAILKKRGFYFIAPESGRLSCGDVGKGKMAEPETIISGVHEILAQSAKLIGKKILVTAGPTIEPLDPVNYITNHSSGKMGYEIAQKAVAMGAEQVTLISGPTGLKAPYGVHFVSVKTTEEMATEVKSRFSACDFLVMAAAPVDMKSTQYSSEKIKKSDHMHFSFGRHEDILMSLKGQKTHQKILGFAAETRDIEEYAVQKLKQKDLDLIAANDVSKSDVGFQSDENEIWLYDIHGLNEHMEKATKAQLAEKLLYKLCLL